MAKFAKITYGTHEDTKEYTYIVNDNVRSGDILQPLVRHAGNGKLFVTTGIAQSVQSANPDTKQGQANIAEVQEELGDKNITTVLTGKEMGIKRAIGERTSGGADIQKVNDRFTNVNPEKYQVTNYIQSTREGNLALAQQLAPKAENLKGISKPYTNQIPSSFDEYSKAYMPKK